MLKKNKKNEQEKIKEVTRWDVFKDHYKNNLAFKSFVKLMGYFIFITALLIAVAVINPENNMPSLDNETTTTTDKETLTYKDVLENVYKNEHKLKISIVANNINYKIEATNKNNVLTGYLETIEGTHKFKIQDNIIKEIKLNNEVDNPDLFKDVDVDFIIPANMVNLLVAIKSVKQVKDDITTYTYDLTKNGSTYKVTTYVSNDTLNKIEIANEVNKYEIVYE